MRALADNGALWALVLLAPIVLFCLPTLIAVIRGVDWLPLVIVFNATGVGWLGALILAFGPRRRQNRLAGPPRDWHRYYTITWQGPFRAWRIDGGPPLEAATSTQLWELMREDFYRRPLSWQP